MPNVPHELSLAGVYFPPALLAAGLGIGAAWLTSAGLSRYRVARFVYYPPLLFVALTIIYTGAASSLLAML